MIIIQTWVIFQCQVKTFNQDPVPKSSLPLAVYQKPLENRKHREWNDRLLANQNIHSSKSKAEMIPWSGEDWKILNGFRYYCMIKKHALNDTKLGVVQAMAMAVPSLQTAIVPLGSGSFSSSKPGIHREPSFPHFILSPPRDVQSIFGNEIMDLIKSTWSSGPPAIHRAELGFCFWCMLLSIENGSKHIRKYIRPF